MRAASVRHASLLTVAFAISMLGSATASANVVLYNNLTPNNSMASASRPDTAPFEIESADDFFLGSRASVTGASFTGLTVPGTGGTPTVAQVLVEIYRIFPLDSDTTRTPTVPTRNNSPSDVAFDTRDSSANQLTFSTQVLAATFSTLNSVQPGGVHVGTQGNGPLTGTETQFDVSFSSPFDLPAGHYFFVPQVLLTNGGQFYWLSASRPISGVGTTPFPAGVTDLQSWTRDAALDPDWLRIGTDIVGGTTPPTFNAAFELVGATIPEPGSITLVGAGLLIASLYRRSRKR